MQLIYIRNENERGEHVWLDNTGQPQFWRGFGSWQHVGHDGLVRYLCPHNWPDGDALMMFRAMRRAQEMRDGQNQTAAR